MSDSIDVLFRIYEHEGRFSKDKRGEIMDSKSWHPADTCTVCNEEPIGTAAKCLLFFAGDSQANERPVVLFAEDDDIMRDSLSLVLENEGFAVIKAKDGAEAMELLTELGDIIDAILSDLKMPRADGEQLARLNAENRRIPFIMHTSMVDHDSALRMIDLGVQNFIVKSANPKPLVQILKSVIFRKIHNVPSKINCEAFGNSGAMTIKTRWDELSFASSWLTGRLRWLAPAGKLNVFIQYVDELLMNCYEHGNLGISREEKSDLIESGRYDDELKTREKYCDKSISIKFSVLGGGISISIKDEGRGFDYSRYLNMTAEEISNSLLKPNGRGIYLASKYFDSIKYNPVGNEVFVLWSLDQGRQT